MFLSLPPTAPGVRMAARSQDLDDVIDVLHVAKLIIAIHNVSIWRRTQVMLCIECRASRKKR